LFSTSVPGVLDKEGNVITEIPVIDKQALALANKQKSASGLGGMISKLTFARLATRMGIKVVIFGIRTDDGILNAIKEQTGTLCHPQECTMSARKKWLASGSLVTGSLQIDAGACNALQNGHSLLAVGAKAVINKFEQGEVFEIVDEDNFTVALARAKVSSDEIAANLKTPKLIIAHADDIVLI
jgi:glutamate 5-kinase